jgi:dienelactone hydrolase
MKLLTVFLFPFLISIMACQSKAKHSDREVHDENTTINDRKSNPDTSLKPALKDTTIFIKRNTDSIRVDIKVPSLEKGVCLLLHGWNLPSGELCQKTDLCKKLLEAGYVLVIPDFGKTTYQFINYPQTRKDFLIYPTRSWMQDTLIPFLQQEFQLLFPEKRNFVYGVSTGGRGAALLALENPVIFKATACLSADFDHFALGSEPINTAYYGSCKLFPDRWKGKDNIHNRAAEFKCGMFLAHGKKDKVCPVQQTENFAAEFEKKNPDLKLKTIIDPAGDHTYTWWNSQTSAVIEFFNEF